MHRVKLAGFGAVSEADAGEGAHLAASSAEEHGGTAVFRSVVVETKFGCLQRAAARDKRDHLVCGVVADAHDFGNLGRGGFTARDAAVRRRLALCNCSGIAVAAGIAAAAAVGARQAFADLGLLGVDFHMENLGRIRQKRAKNRTQYAQHDDCKED